MKLVINKYFDHLVIFNSNETYITDDPGAKLVIKQFVLSASNLVGPIVLIGDNLGSHFSVKVLQY